MSNPRWHNHREDMPTGMNHNHFPADKPTVGPEEPTSTDLALAPRKLGNSSFKAKAPSEVVAKEEAKEAELSALVETIVSQLTELGR